MIRSFFAISALALSLGMGLNATTITYATPSGAVDTNGDAVNASAVFTTSDNNTLTITLTNLETNIKDAGQLLTDLEFTLSVGGTSTLSSSSANLILVNSNKLPAPDGSAGTGWGFGTNGSNLMVCAVCGNNSTVPVASGPADGIIGPGPYTNANGSIAGNGPHNPFIDQTATFVINNPLINSTTTVNSAIFSFGTTFGDDVTGVPTSSAPEPVSMALFGVGLLGVGLIRRRVRS